MGELNLRRAGVLAGLEAIEREPERIAALHANVQYVNTELRRLGFDVDAKAAIIPLKIPPSIDIREMAVKVHEAGVFVKPIGYPAVPLNASGSASWLPTPGKISIA